MTASTPGYAGVRKVRCSVCSHRLLDHLEDCACAKVVQQIKCRRCNSVLLIRSGYIVEVVGAIAR